MHETQRDWSHEDWFDRIQRAKLAREQGRKAREGQPPLDPIPRRPLTPPLPTPQNLVCNKCGGLADDVPHPSSNGYICYICLDTLDGCRTDAGGLPKPPGFVV